MKKRGRRSSPARRRTTLTLPADSLARAERIARSRNVTLSSVVAEAFVDGMRKHEYAERAEAVLARYQKAFSGLSEEEMMIVDGIILQPPRRSR